MCVLLFFVIIYCNQHNISALGAACLPLAFVAFYCRVLSVVNQHTHTLQQCCRAARALSDTRAKYTDTNTDTDTDTVTA